MKKRILTGLQATGSQLHIGNYFAAVKPMIDILKENDYESFIFVATMHSFTELHESNKLKEYLRNLLKIYLACGVDIENTYIYNHATIPGHSQLNRVLTCISNLGTMQRMHVYKDAIQKGKAHDISVGTFCYPILMAADILLYDADFVPVGQDQKQHIEFARDIAIKFNSTYGQTFVLPEAIIKKEVAIVPGIDGRKMSKSYNNYIGLLEDEKIIFEKVRQIFVNSKIIKETKNPDSCNVYNILKLFLNENDNYIIRKKYREGNISYEYLKNFLYEKILNTLKPIQSFYNSITDEQIDNIINKNQQKLIEISNKKIKDVYKKIGFSF